MTPIVDERPQAPRAWPWILLLLLALVAESSAFWWYLRQDGAGQEVMAQDVEAHRHVVQAGDSLWSIAAARLGHGTRWREIADLNRIENPCRLEIGRELELP